MAVQPFFMNEFQGARLLMRDLANAQGGVMLVSYADKTFSYTADTNADQNPVDGRGVLVSVLVTVLKAAAVTIYDSASAASGTILAHIEASAAAGTIRFFHMPFANGIYFAGAATYPGLTIAYMSAVAAN